MKTITVNGRVWDVPHKILHHDNVMMLAYGPGTSFGVATITYSRGPLKKPSGSLFPGETVALKNGMIFTAVKTDKA
jgi:hypothetical protein